MADENNNLYIPLHLTDGDTLTADNLAHIEKGIYDNSVHKENEDIHITEEDKNKWNSKQDVPISYNGSLPSGILKVNSKYYIGQLSDNVDTEIYLPQNDDETLSTGDTIDIFFKTALSLEHFVAFKDTNVIYNDTTPSSYKYYHYHMEYDGSDWVVFSNSQSLIK